MKKLTFGFLVVVLLAITPSAWAISTLHIGFGVGNPCAVGCGGHPNVPAGSMASDEFDIYQNSGGAGTLGQPVLLIIGVPDVTNPNFFSAASIIELTSVNGGTVNGDGSISGGTTVGSPPNTWTYGTTAFGLSSYVQGSNFTSGEVYSDVLGLSNANMSNNFGNWHDADLAINGIDPTGFGIYVFGLNGALGPKGALNITFANETTVPIGSYVIGYGMTVSSRGKVKYFSTPFTESGLQCCRQVPEPSSLILLGSGLVGLGLWGKRRRKG